MNKFFIVGKNPIELYDKFAKFIKNNSSRIGLNSSYFPIIFKRIEYFFRTSKIIAGFVSSEL